MSIDNNKLIDYCRVLMVGILLIGFKNGRLVERL